jgi:hypothetical protein
MRWAKKRPKGTPSKMILGGPGGNGSTKIRTVIVFR